ncbi:hypothetical protein MNEG_14118, partial [Monoraphidium neglectum]
EARRVPRVLTRGKPEACEARGEARECRAVRRGAGGGQPHPRPPPPLPGVARVGQRDFD